MRCRTLAPAVLLASILLARPAGAESTPEDRAAADALYAEAGRLMLAERWAEACPKLEASLRLDPGIGTTLRLGHCYEKTGRTASAWSLYNDAESMARKAQDKRAAEAAQRAQQMEPLLSRIVLDVAPENQAGGVEIRRDGRVIDPGAWASAVPIDPGEHTLEASGPGRLAWKATIRIEARPGKTSVQVPPLQPAPPSATPEGPRPYWGAQRIAGAAIGGAGLLGLAMGAAMGGLAIEKNNASKADCDPKDPRRCTQAGADLRLKAGRFADQATGAFIVGGVLAAAGITVFLTAPKGEDAKKTGQRFEVLPVIGSGTAGLGLRGVW